MQKKIGFYKKKNLQELQLLSLITLSVCVGIIVLYCQKGDQQIVDNNAMSLGLLYDSVFLNCRLLTQ